MADEVIERERPKPPTPRQLAMAADICTRFVESRIYDPEEYTTLRNAAHLMGMAALAEVARS